MPTNVRVDPASHYEPLQDLYVITCYSNPAGFETRRRNYHLFARRLEASSIAYLCATDLMTTRYFNRRG